jgi:hypothetical protein
MHLNGSRLEIQTARRPQLRHSTSSTLFGIIVKREIFFQPRINTDETRIFRENSIFITPRSKQSKNDHILALLRGQCEFQSVLIRVNPWLNFLSCCLRQKG